jgi:hypothetical protein
VPGLHASLPAFLHASAWIRCSSRACFLAAGELYRRA